MHDEEEERKEERKRRKARLILSWTVLSTLKNVSTTVGGAFSYKIVKSSRL